MNTTYVIVKGVIAVTINVGFLVLGILLFARNNSKPGDVIKYESQEWKKGPIADFLSLNGNVECPEDYERV